MIPRSPSDEFAAGIDSTSACDERRVLQLGAKPRHSKLSVLIVSDSFRSRNGAANRAAPIDDNLVRQRAPPR
jgi:hypothetical protein